MASTEKCSSPASVSPGSIALKWVHLLEKEFDKVYIELDAMLGDLEEDHQVIALQGQEKLTAMSAAFGQLVHKALAVCQLNVKLQVQLDETKAALLAAESAQATAQHETRSLLSRLQAAQLDASRQRLAASATDDTQAVQTRLEEQARDCDKLALAAAALSARERAELQLLRVDNVRLHKSLANCESELVGAKLAAKYLDKELAGRIQQIQLLNGNFKPAEQDRLWCQLQSEIRLHRHKTVIRACRARLDRESLEEERARTARMPPSGEVRRVVVYKAHNEGLGISITGGKEHGVPILVSEVHPHMAGWRSGQLFVGDAILSVNDVDIRQALHDEAVEILSKQEGSVELELLWIDEQADQAAQQAEDIRDAHEAALRYHFFAPNDLSVNGTPGTVDDNGSALSQATTKASTPKIDDDISARTSSESGSTG